MVYFTVLFSVPSNLKKISSLDHQDSSMIETRKLVQYEYLTKKQALKISVLLHIDLISSFNFNVDNYQQNLC